MSDHNGSTYKAVPGKIPGTTLNLGGRDYVIAPLNLNQVEALESRIKTLGTKETMAENLADAAVLVHASLSRNYEGITIEDVRDMIDLGNFEKAAKAVVAISGFAAVPKDTLGEAVPASQ